MYIYVNIKIGQIAVYQQSGRERAEAQNKWRFSSCLFSAISLKGEEGEGEEEGVIIRIYRSTRGNEQR